MANTAFGFSALHYTDEDLYLVKYANDLDCAFMGLGNASCGEGPQPQSWRGKAWNISD